MNYLTKFYQLLLSGILLLSTSLSFGQATCMDMTEYDGSYLADVSADDVTYPIGEAFMSFGDIDIVKMETALPAYAIGGPTTFLYWSDIAIDVSASELECKELSFELTTTYDAISIDGEGGWNVSSIPDTYTGSGWEMEHDNSGGNSVIIISGDFDEVLIEQNVTGMLSDVCLEDCGTTGGEETCMDMTEYDGSYLSGVSSDDVTYPIGDPFMSFGDIDIVKMETAIPSYAIGGPTTFLYWTDIAIDVSNSDFECKQLSFELTTTYDAISIDGEGGWNVSDIPDTYSGTGWEMEHDNSGGNSVITISGDFDEVLIEQSVTGMLSNVCLEDCSSGTSSTEELNINFTIYPNPANEVLMLDGNGNRFTSGRLISTDGKVMLDFEINEQITQIDLSDIQAGFYLVRLTDINGQIYLKKLIRE